MDTVTFRNPPPPRTRWEIDPQKAAHIQLIFELVGDHRFTLGAVQRELARRSITTASGNTNWDRSTLRDILCNTAYFGEARYGKERLVPRKQGKRAKRGDPQVPRRAKVAQATEAHQQIVIPVPAIIDRDLFDRVALQMNENQKRQRERQAGGRYLLSGVVLCGACGSAYCGRRHGPRKYFYYRCIGRDKHRQQGRPICSNASVNGETLEELAWSELCNLLREPKRLQSEIARRQEEQSQPNTRLRKLQSEIQSLRGRLDRLIDAFTNGLIEKVEFEQRIGPLRQRHDQEVAALASLQGELHDALDGEAAENILRRLAEDVESQLDTADWRLRRELIQLLIKRIEIHENEIRIVFRVPPNPFARRPDTQGFLQHCLQRRCTALRCGGWRCVSGRAPRCGAEGWVRVSERITSGLFSREDAVDVSIVNQPPVDVGLIHVGAIVQRWTVQDQQVRILAFFDAAQPIL